MCRFALRPVEAIGDIEVMQENTPLGKWNRRTSLALVIAFSTVMVLSSMAFATGALTLVANPLSHTAAPAASAPAIQYADEPLSTVSGPASLSVTGPTIMGSYSILPDPSQFSSSAKLTATVTFTPTSDLQTMVNNLGNPASPDYRQYLSPAGLGATFGASAAAYAGAIQYFESLGLSVTPSPTFLTLGVTGTVAQLESAFHTQLASFVPQYTSDGVWNAAYGASSSAAGQTFTGKPFLANVRSVQLPRQLAGIVAAVTGLDGATASPDLALPVGLSPSILASQASTQTALPASIGTPLTMNQTLNDSYGNFTWADLTPHSVYCADYNLCGDYQFLWPSSIAVMMGDTALWGSFAHGGFYAYNTVDGGVPQTYNQLPDLGAGVTIGLVEVGCMPVGDILNYSAMVFGNPYQLENRVTQIGINGSILPGYPVYGTQTNYASCITAGEDWGWTGETAVDIEEAAAMAPDAHIDIIASSSADYSSFDQAYSMIINYMVSSATCSIPASVGAVFSGSSGEGACTVSETSNSYGSGEQSTAVYGSPVYITAEDQLLLMMNAEGVTNFFASGDGGGTADFVNDFMAADSPGATSVGGGELTAVGRSGLEFPTKGVGTVCADYDSATHKCLMQPFGIGVPMRVAQTAGIGSFTYWDYGEGIGGTYNGLAGGGFGTSNVEPQEWWQNAFDSYSSGSRIDPIISGSADFNMSFYLYGSWYGFYGGTSFATPIFAGSWALVESEVNEITSSPDMGNINAALYNVHNAWEASAANVAAAPYAPMTNIGWQLTAGPINSWTWYYFNLSIQDPSATESPWWFTTLGNGAGPYWNYLGGLGLPNLGVMSKDVVGLAPGGQSVINEPIAAIEDLTKSAPLKLHGGTDYGFTLATTGSIMPGSVKIWAYSGGSNSGTYAGGTVVAIKQTSVGHFSYRPTYASTVQGSGGLQYGYFLLKSTVGKAWALEPFAVAPPVATGPLTLCVTTSYGACGTGVAETSGFSSVFIGNYNVFSEASVSLDGNPVSAAEVNEVAVNATLFGSNSTNCFYCDPTVPPAFYAPGVTVAHYISDARGTVLYWTNSWVSEINGTLYPTVVNLTATYDGLTSNTVTVFIEPQSGSLDPNVALNGGGTAVVGTVNFADLKYANFVNVSIGSAPGQFVNTTFPPVLYDSLSGTYSGGAISGNIPVDLSTAGLTPPYVVSVVAEGSNDLSFHYCFFGFCYGEDSIQNPMWWFDPVVLLPAPVTVSPSGPDAALIAYSGTAYPGATGSLALVAGGLSSALATGLHGVYDLDTAGLANGFYTVEFTESAPGAVTTVHTVVLQVDHSVTFGLHGFAVGLPVLLVVAAAAATGGIGAGILLGRRARKSAGRSAPEGPAA